MPNEESAPETDASLNYRAREDKKRQKNKGRVAVSKSVVPPTLNAKFDSARHSIQYLKKMEKEHREHEKRATKHVSKQLAAAKPFQKHLRDKERQKGKSVTSPPQSPKLVKDAAKMTKQVVQKQFESPKIKPNKFLYPPCVLGDYFLSGKIASDKFTTTFYSRTIHDRRYYAVKVEMRGNTLPVEVNCLRAIHHWGSRQHIPEVFFYNPKRQHRYMAMTLLGKSLRELKPKCYNRRMTRGTWSRLAIQALYAIKTVHEVGFLHRNIKPDNLVMGSPDDRKRHRILFLVDFGLARRWAARLDNDMEYINAGGDKAPIVEQGAVANNGSSDPAVDGDKKKKKSIKDPKKEVWGAIPLRRKVSFRGTLRYCSPNMHRRIEQGRRDDLWSLIYTLIYLDGGLPWLRTKTEEEIMRMKLDTETWLKDRPEGLKHIVEHLQTCSILERPNYHLLFVVFHEMMKSNNAKPDTKYSWEYYDLNETERASRVHGKWENTKGTYFTSDYLGINGPQKMAVKWVNPEIELKPAPMATECPQMHPNLTAQQVMDKNLAAFELREFADRIRAKYNRRMKQRQPRNYIGEMVKDGTMEKAKHRVKHPRGGEHMTLEQVLEWV